MHGEPDARTDGRTIASGRGYDALVAAFFLGRRRRVFTEIARLSRAESGGRVLDVGCGTGYLTRILARRVGESGGALGVDPSPGPLARARSLAGDLPHCGFHDGIAEQLPAPDDTFDVVVSSLMIHHLPPDVRAQAADEMFRVLRPGGTVLIADFRPPSGPIGRRWTRKTFGEGMADNPIHLLAPLVRNAGFEDPSEGDLRPWIHWVRAVKPNA
jgi:ubiquinone/menaquinone biosynthesis C-methylase UbiE